MRWLVTLSGNTSDVELLAGENLDDRLSIDPENPGQLLLELHDPEGDATGDDASHAAHDVIDDFVQSINSYGKLRWGRSFAGLSDTKRLRFSADGTPEQIVRIGPAYDHMQPDDFADVVEQLGFPRPDEPRGFETVKQLDCASVTALAEEHENVARVLKLIERMLAGDEQIDWVAANAAHEIINEDLRDRGLPDGQTLGWWTRNEYDRFRVTANSPAALGIHARHGKRSRLTEARMNYSEASWFVRGIVAASLLQMDSG
jgi:hypothetical protein